MSTNNSKACEVSEDVAALIIEALSITPLSIDDEAYTAKVNEAKEIRKCLKIDVSDRKGPYQLSNLGKVVSVRALSSISVPVTHPNWVTLTELLIKARVELGLV
jgi:hypothetical protein